MSDDALVAPGKHLDPFETKPEEKGVAMVMALIAQVAVNSGTSSIKDHQGLWSYYFGDRWTILVNGHEQNITYKTITIPPYHALIEHFGAPALLTGPYEGFLADGANEFEVIDALTEELRRLNRSRPEQNPLTGG